MEREVEPQWRKATYSQSNGGACVEVGNVQGKILVRDTTQREAGHIDVAAGAWQAFVNGLK